jgi:preprotein translocase subunit SecD
MGRIFALGFAVLLMEMGCSSFSAEDATTRLVFRLSPSENHSDIRLDQARRVIEQRLDETQIVSSFLVQVKQPDELVILTGDVTPEQQTIIKELATVPGTMEFAILANLKEHAALIAQAQSGTDISDPSATQSAAWISAAVKDDGTVVDLWNDETLITREIERDGQTVSEYLVVFGSPDERVTNQYLTSIEALDTKDGKEIEFGLSERGGSLMQALTQIEQPVDGTTPRYLAVIIEGSLWAAPRINAPVGRAGRITANNSKADVERIVASLNSGQLASKVEFVRLESLAKKE